MSRSKPTAETHKLSLILGADGAGKSTFARGIADATDAMVHEATAGPHGKALYKKHQRQPVDANLVFERETMYAGLNGVFQDEIREHLKKTDVLTTGSMLVTRLANVAMRSVICQPNAMSPDDVTAEWLTDADRAPDEIIYLHAPMDVITSRLFERLKGGNIRELPRAYNSPFYLKEYDRVLGDAVLYITKNSTIPVFNYDASAMSPDELVNEHLNQNIETL